VSAKVRRAFPVVYATDVAATARFWERLGFTQFVQLPAEGDPGYTLVAALRAEGVTVLGDPADMPWGERIAAVADPDGNPVALANQARVTPA
jgi:lactoylglutathione lyase